MIAVHLRDSGAARKVPGPASAYLTERFHLAHDYVDRLRCFEQEGVFHEAEARHLHIFDARLARELGLDIRSSADLERHPEVLGFRGYVDAAGRVYFADRRPPGAGGLVIGRRGFSPRLSVLNCGVRALQSAARRRGRQRTES
jgi:hypothetical protein